MKLELLTEKKKLLDAHRPLPKELIKNLAEWFRVELTYSSNALEGNTLSRRETAVILNYGITVGGKSIKEHLEAQNHAQAFDYIQTLITKKTDKIELDDILKIHYLILQNIEQEHAGRFRHVPVRISGSRVVLPNPQKVPDLMQQFIENLHHSKKQHPIEIAMHAHYQLVTIHPFIDGNGRTARLLMNLILMQNGYPPVIISKQNRLRYLTALEKAQLGGSNEDYQKLILRSVNRSLDIYLKTIVKEFPKI